MVPSTVIDPVYDFRRVNQIERDTSKGERKGGRGEERVVCEGGSVKVFFSKVPDEE